jgi:protein involved in sex pheromone biosynthesis
MKKKVISVILAVMLIAAGCAGGTDDSQTDSGVVSRQTDEVKEEQKEE